MVYQEIRRDFPDRENQNLSVCPDLESHIRGVLDGKKEEARVEEFVLHPKGIKKEVRWYLGPNEPLPYGTKNWGESWDKYARSLFDIRYLEYVDVNTIKDGVNKTVRVQALIVSPLRLRDDEFIGTEQMSYGIQVPQIKLYEYAGSVRSVTAEDGTVVHNRRTPLYRRFRVVVFPDSRMVDRVSINGGNNGINQQDRSVLAEGIISNHLTDLFLVSRNPLDNI